MPLLKIPQRNSKELDIKVAKKSKSTIKAPVAIKGGGGLMGRIAVIKAEVIKRLGKYADKYILIQDEDILANYIDKCIVNKVISIDTETTGLDPLLDDIVGICIYTPNMPAAYIPLNHISAITSLKLPNQLDINTVRSYFKSVIQAHIDIIMFNASFDIRFLRNKVGLKDIYCTWDCYLASMLLNENDTEHNLKWLHKKYVLEDKEDAFRFDDLFKGVPFNVIPLDVAVLYAAHDPEITYELYDYQRRFIRDDSDRKDMRDINWVLKNIEMPCISVVADMEDRGIKFDFAYNNALKEKYHKIIEEKKQAFYKACEPYSLEFSKYAKLESPINIDSTQQLAILLYDIMKCDLFYDKKRHKETRSTAEEALTKLDNPVSKAILEYRSFSTLVGTFIDKLPTCVNPNDGRIHCNFNQYGAKTGRFSSSNPNLQNIPSHNKDIRKMFVASDGYVLMSSDFSQQEPKCLAALCRKHGDSQMYDTFMAGKDLYSEIASKAFNKPYEECREFNTDGTTNKAGKERRTQAKSILLGVLYGRGTNSIAEQLGCTPEKAQTIKDSVFKGFPAIKQFEQDSLSMAEELGYVTTISGRKRRLPDLQLDEYEFSWASGSSPSGDLLDFDSNDDADIDVPEKLIRKYTTMLHKCKFNEKYKVKNKAKEADGIIIVDNGGKIADAERQCVNARIQGSAADLTKIAMIELNNNKRLNELGFRLLIPVHDEVIAECPEENVRECSKLLADIMSKSAETLLEMPIRCDVEITKAWYGDKIEMEG